MELLTSQFDMQEIEVSPKHFSDTQNTIITHHKVVIIPQQIFVVYDVCRYHKIRRYDD